MARIIARFSEGLPQVGGKSVEYTDGKLWLEGGQVSLKPEQVVAAVATGKAVWVDVAAGAALESRFAQAAASVMVGMAAAAANPSTDSSPAASTPGSQELVPKPKGAKPLTLALIAAGVILVAAVAGWFLYPYVIGTDTPAATPSKTTTGTPAPSAAASSSADASGNPTYTVDPSSPTSTAPTVSVLSGYLKGYDPNSPDRGVLLLYREDGSAVPVAYDTSTAFLVSGKSSPIEAFVKSYATLAGKPAVLLSFTVKSVQDAVAILGAKTASSTVDPAAIRLYLVTAKPSS